MQLNLRPSLPHRAHRRHVIAVHVREKKMLHTEIVFSGNREQVIREPARVKNRRRSRIRIPHHETVHRKPLGGGHHPQFLPPRQIHRLRLPSIGHRLSLGDIQTQALRQSHNLHVAFDHTLRFPLLQLCLGQASQSGRFADRGLRLQTGFAADVSDMILQWHTARLAKCLRDCQRH